MAEPIQLELQAQEQHTESLTFEGTFSSIIGNPYVYPAVSAV